jgi:hypothetical protein
MIDRVVAGAFAKPLRLLQFVRISIDLRIAAIVYSALC